MVNGIINILKPPGMTSHDIVDLIRRNFNIKKAGHTGTLDPGATGVLVVCMGKATRLAGYLLQEDKEYRFEITFGMATSTGDSYGEAIAFGDAAKITEQDVRTALPLFTGNISQTPPMHSALKYKGRKLYELAREGVVVERPARLTRIDSLEFVWGTGWGSNQPRALINIACSKGTYVRSLCDDIGKYFRCGAHMSFLVRTKSGPFSIENSATIEELQDACSAGTIEARVVKIEDVLGGFPEVRVKSGAVRAVVSGSKLYPPGVEFTDGDIKSGTLVRLTGTEGLLALAKTAVDSEKHDRFIFKPICVFSE